MQRSRPDSQPSTSAAPVTDGKTGSTAEPALYALIERASEALEAIAEVVHAGDAPPDEGALRALQEIAAGVRPLVARLAGEVPLLARIDEASAALVAAHDATTSASDADRAAAIVMLREWAATALHLAARLRLEVTP